MTAPGQPSGGSGLAPSRGHLAPRGVRPRDGSKTERVRYLRRLTEADEPRIATRDHEVAELFARVIALGESARSSADWRRQLDVTHGAE